MFRLLKLILPVLFPSWRFFSGIGPSPRIEYAYLADSDQQLDLAEWQPLNHTPPRLGLINALWRYCHNPVWNEQLYLNTCAEHLFEGYSVFFDQEIGNRLCAKVWRGELSAPSSAQFLVYRLRAIFAYEASPYDNAPVPEVITFTSRAFVLVRQLNRC